MELLVGDGWTQVEPRETDYEIPMADQSQGQRLMAVETSFARRRDIGFAGGRNCPLAIDNIGDQVFVSVDGITSYRTHGNEPWERKISDDLSPGWMLKYVNARHELLLHHQPIDTSEIAIARLDIEKGSVRKELLPKEAYFPLDVNSAHSRVLYSTRRGAAIYDISGALEIVATIDLPFHIKGGAFDFDESRVVLGGNGIIGWNTTNGKMSRLSKLGNYPAIDGNGCIWFSYKEGGLAKLSGEAGKFDVIAELTGMETAEGDFGSYARPMSFSPETRYGLATLTGRTALTGKDLEEAEAFCKRVGQPFLDFYRYSYHHFFCVLDLTLREVWCSKGYAHNVAWLKKRKRAEAPVSGL